MRFQAWGFAVCFSILVIGCTVSPPPKPELTLKKTSFEDLPGWSEDDHEAALAAFRLSCEKLLKLPPDRLMGPAKYEKEMGHALDWQETCRVLDRQTFVAVSAKTYFEENFTPYLVGNHGKSEGLFTGYYEPLLKGSRTKHGPYTTPLHIRPADLISVELGDFREELKGQRIAGRIINNKLKPFEDRAAIENGALDNKNLELVWVDSPIDAFFLHVQGSGRIQMEDGSEMRVGYAAQNGHPYTSIGKILKDRGLIQKDKITMPDIKSWLLSHPDQAQSIMNQNASYVFFRLLERQEVIGAQNVPLTEKRSLAVDRTFIPLGAPLWLDTVDPFNPNVPIRQLMIAQDTGGAIKGPVRGDIFWGHGPKAELYAGAMQSKGRYFILLPKREN